MKFVTLSCICCSILVYSGCAQKPAQNRFANPSGDSLVYEALPDAMLANLKKEKESLARKMSAAQLTYFVIKAPENQFGYSIFIDGQMYIEQKNIPGVEGNKGFATKEDAETIAKLVIQKIRDGEMPPTVTPAELSANGILN